MPQAPMPCDKGRQVKKILDFGAECDIKTKKKGEKEKKKKESDKQSINGIVDHLTSSINFSVF